SSKQNTQRGHLLVSFTNKNTPAFLIFSPMLQTLNLTLAFCLFCLASAAQVPSGKASFYADKFEGRPTASGQKYRHNKLTAAHKTLPFGTKVKVTNTRNNKSVVVPRSAPEWSGFVN